MSEKEAKTEKEKNKKLYKIARWSQIFHVHKKVSQLGSGVSLQSYLYFQDFWGSKLLIGCVVV